MKNSYEKWGYEHPDVKGPKALIFFTWDISRTIDMAFRDVSPDQLELSLKVAQAGIDSLLNKYIEIGADPETFEGQSIRVEVGQLDGKEDPIIALQTSPELEQKIMNLKAYLGSGRA